MRILYIEDNDINRIIFEESLKLKAEVTCVENGPDGLSLTENHSYDLIVIDLNLNDPTMDGFDVIRKLNTNGYREKNKVKIIALTAYTGPDWERKCKEAGFDSFHSKPINPLALLIENEL